MKNSFKTISAIFVGIMIGGLSVVGANQAIQAIQNENIKISLNGQIQTFRDETTGEVMYPITYHDRTYLPLRNVCQLAGLRVDYSFEDNEAILTTEDYNEVIEEKVDEEELESYLEYFYSQNYEDLHDSVYIANTSSYMFRQFFSINYTDYSIDASTIHEIIKETTTKDIEKPFPSAYVFTDEQEKRLNEGEDLYNIIPANDEYALSYSKSRDVYYTIVGDGFGYRYHIQITDLEYDNNMYTIRFKAWSLPEDLSDDYYIPNVGYDWDGYKMHLTNDVEPDNVVEIQLYENSGYKYSKYKMISFNILENA